MQDATDELWKKKETEAFLFISYIIYKSSFMTSQYSIDLFIVQCCLIMLCNYNIVFEWI